MRIAFDAKRAFTNSSGLGNYSRALIKSIVELYPNNQYSLYTPTDSNSEFAEFMRSKLNVEICTPRSLSSKSLPFLWRSFSITKHLQQNNTSIYHGLSNELPFNIALFRNFKVVSIHDLIFLRYPELYPFFDRKMYYQKVKQACKTADCIIAISKQSQADLIEYFAIPESKIKVVYQSCDPVFHSPPSPEQLIAVGKKYKLPKQFILSVGTIEERKNLLTLVKALKQCKELELVVVGRKRAYYKQVANFIVENNLQARIHFLEDVANSELPALYHLAKLFVYPSFFEGFGIPILESLTCKTPVIAANSSSLPEVGGTHTVYFEPTNVDQLAAEIKRVFYSETLCKDMAEQGYLHAQKFLPDAVAQTMMNLYLNEWNP